MQIEKEEYSKIIYKSSLIFRIKKAALPALKILKKEVNKKYSNISINLDTQTIIKEMVNSFSEAFFSLFEEKHAKLDNLDWSGGYILGFFASNLWTHWKGEYLYPKTPEYQNLMFLRSVYFYSKIDCSLNYQYIDRIQRIYNYFTKPEMRSADCANDIKNNLIFLEDFKKQTKISINKKFADSLINYLETLFLQEHYKAFDKITINDNLDDVCDFFEINEIVELIKFIKFYN